MNRLQAEPAWIGRKRLRGKHGFLAGSQGEVVGERHANIGVATGDYTIRGVVGGGTRNVVYIIGQPVSLAEGNTIRPKKNYIAARRICVEYFVRDSGLRRARIVDDPVFVEKRRRHIVIEIQADFVGACARVEGVTQVSDRSEE